MDPHIHRLSHSFASVREKRQETEKRQEEKDGEVVVMGSIELGNRKKISVAFPQSWIIAFYFCSIISLLVNVSFRAAM